MDNKMTAEQALAERFDRVSLWMPATHSGKARMTFTEEEIDIIRQALSAPRVQAMWLSAKDGEHFPKTGMFYLVRYKGSLLQQVFQFDQADDGMGGGEYFWSNDLMEICPTFSWEHDEFLDISKLDASPEPVAQTIEQGKGKVTGMSVGRISNDHHYACREIVAERDELRAEVEALKAKNDALIDLSNQLDKMYRNLWKVIAQSVWRLAYRGEKDAVIKALRESISDAARLREGGGE